MSIDRATTVLKTPRELQSSDLSEDAGKSDAVSRLIRRQRILISVTSGAAVLAVGGLIASTLIKSPAELAASQSAPAASTLTAPVRSEVLAQQVVVRGNVVAGGSLQMTPTAAQGATALVVTGEPLSVGSTIEPGKVLVQVSGRPVFALPGATPAYRDLKPGDQGGDVTELQSALRSLGYPDDDPHGAFGSGTKTAVRDLYEHLGYDPATTGGLDDLGDQTTLQADGQAVTTAERTLTQANEVLAHDETAAHPNAPTVNADRQNVQWDEQALAAARQADATEIADTGYELPMNEFVFVPSFPATLVAVNGAVGATVAAPLLTIDTGKLVVDAVIQQSDEAMLRQGMSAEIDAEVLGKSAAGKLSYLGPYSDAAEAGTQQQSQASITAQTAQGGQAQGAPGYPITVTPSSSLDPTTWLGQNVRLTITAASTAGKVLAVPVAAITTSANGRTIVLLRDNSTGTERQITVTVGVTADGMCAVTPVTPGSLTAQDTVVIGQ